MSTQSFPITPADLATLKIAASVSKSLHIKQDRKVLTAKNASIDMPDSTLFMAANVGFTFPRDVSIGDAWKLLSMLESFDKPVIELDDGAFITITGEGRGARHRMMMAGKAAIMPFICGPEAIPVKNDWVCCDIGKQDFNVLMHACKISNLQFLRFDGVDGEVTVTAIPGVAKNKADRDRFAEADQFVMPMKTVKVEDRFVGKFSLMIRLADMKMPGGDYKVYFYPEADEAAVKFVSDIAQFWICAQGDE